MKRQILGSIALLLAFIQLHTVYCASKRSIDLINVHTVMGDYRLSGDLNPVSYIIDIHPYISEGHFNGRVKIHILWKRAADRIALHAHEDLVFSLSDLKVTEFVPGGGPSTEFKILRTELPKENQPCIIIYLAKSYNAGTECQVELSYSGKLYNETGEGFFQGKYVDSLTGEEKWYLGSNLRSNAARKAFPCFDEPYYKAKFSISIVRSSKLIALSNMPLRNSEELAKDPLHLRDYFHQTPLMSTFSLGIHVSEFVSINVTKINDTDVKIWARPDFINAVENSVVKIAKALRALEHFWGMSYPLPKLDCVALPSFQSTRPADNWGLILFKESELSSKNSWQISHELVYQWLGASATPQWWNHAHINNALAKYIATYITLKISDGKETFHNWPMTMLYSIYYEFSKRYPHGKVMAIKQDSVSTKTELVFRMLNYTLGEECFINAMRSFMIGRKLSTFFADDIWTALNDQAHIENKLANDSSVHSIAISWVSKDRLPVVNIIRNYENNTATVSQRVYLRERPHDVPDQEKLLWWIPIILITQNKMDFTNSTPIVWMKNQREISLDQLPDSDQFIILNPEEIGPFPVNYDTRNWNLLATFLQSTERCKIPVNTRAKLLHDAWNLAYAGDLNFGIALNMTLFLKYERHYLAWDPVFTMIDHIGRHIDGSSVHKKFLTYVRILLTPLYEDLGNEPQEDESEGQSNLRNSCKVFLCQAGYKPCIEEAQEAFKKWREAENPDEGNPVSNQYICPVFKWGTKDEWEFGLQRVINFPAGRKQSERTYLLKTLAGCPIDSWKIEKLLNITILEKNKNFIDNDIYLIFSMLTGGSSGYTTLFNYLDRNWDILRKVFAEKPQLWNSLVTSSVSVFKTQEGLEMVKNLYSKRKGELGTVDFVIEKALKNIKEEAKWSNDNLPVIETWLNNYLEKNKAETDENNKFL